MKADSDKLRNDEQELALDAPGFEVDHHNFKDCALTPVDVLWRCERVALLHLRRDQP